MGNEALMELRNVCKTYRTGEGGVQALRNISLRIDRGEFAAIIGQSGSGKSTLMNVLGCLDTPDRGEYALAGERVSGMDDRMLSAVRSRQIGFVFQGFNLIPTLDALENVELPLLYRRVARDARRRLALEALDRVGLSGRLDHRPGQMSGGQQQRVAIARAIAAKPSILLADEPTGNLDSQSGGEVLCILRDLWSEGRTVVIITHDNHIARSAERVLQLHDGEIVRDDPLARNSIA